jgi:hypothetical protein
MSRRPELSLDDDLMVRKGEAKGIGPTAAVTQPPDPESRPSLTQAPHGAPAREPAPPIDAAEDRPIIVGKRRTIERVYTNVRIPKDLDERLYVMLVETRRTKQDIIETFIRDGLDRHETARRRGRANGITRRAES